MDKKYSTNHEFFEYAVAVRIQDLINSGITMTEIKRRTGYGASVPLHKIIQMASFLHGGFYDDSGFRIYYDDTGKCRLRKVFEYADSIANF
jgi:hypothetical protein